MDFANKLSERVSGGSYSVSWLSLSHSLSRVIQACSAGSPLHCLTTLLSRCCSVSHYHTVPHCLTTCTGPWNMEGFGDMIAAGAEHIAVR